MCQQVVYTLPMMNTARFGAWLNQEIVARKTTQARVAAGVGVGRTTVTGWVAGNKPDVDHLAQLAVLWNVPLKDVWEQLDLELPEVDREHDELPRPLRIPIIDDVAADQEDEWIGIVDYTSWVPDTPGADASKLFAVRVHGSCLEPFICDGDIAIADAGLKPVEGDYVVIRVDQGRSQVKILERRGARWVYVAEDGKEVAFREVIEVRGVVVTTQRPRERMRRRRRT